MSFLSVQPTAHPFFFNPTTTPSKTPPEQQHRNTSRLRAPNTAKPACTCTRCRRLLGRFILTQSNPMGVCQPRNTVSSPKPPCMLASIGLLCNPPLVRARHRILNTLGSLACHNFPSLPLPCWVLPPPLYYFSFFLAISKKFFHSIYGIFSFHSTSCFRLGIFFRLIVLCFVVSAWLPSQLTNGDCDAQFPPQPYVPPWPQQFIHTQTAKPHADF